MTTPFSKSDKELKLTTDLQRRNSILASMVQIMRSKGASEQAIQRTLKGIDEFAKFAIKPDDPLLSGQPQPEHPQPSLTSDEALGQLLSEVAMQEVRWLWEKRSRPRSSHGRSRSQH